MEKKARQLNQVFFLLYCLCLLWLLFNREYNLEGVPYWQQVADSINLKPFHTIRLYTRLLTDPVRPYLTKLAVINLAGNVLMFIPFGYFLPAIWPKLRGFLKTVLVSALTVVTVEISQVLLLVGSCDIDDLILNLLGVAAGYGFCKLTKKAGV